MNFLGSTVEKEFDDTLEISVTLSDSKIAGEFAVLAVAIDFTRVLTVFMKASEAIQYAENYNLKITDNRKKVARSA